MSYSGYESINRSIQNLNDAYAHSITSNHPQCEQPALIKVPLRAHQKAMLYQMEKREQDLCQGMDLSGGRLYGQFSFLGDGVGVGKSLMVLGHIARLRNSPPLPKIYRLESNSTSSLYSLYEDRYSSAMRVAGCLIVVPHTLFRQWQTYIKEQTTLNYVGIQTRKALEKNTFLQDLQNADVILVSNTLYGSISEYANANRILWRRVFYDEADTLHIPSTRIKSEAYFTWLISASWTNILFPNQGLYISNTLIQDLMSGQSHNQRLHPECREYLQHAHQNFSSGAYTHIRHYFMSPSFFREFIHTSSLHRGRLVLRCTNDFVKESITLPPIVIRNIHCRPSLTQQIVSNAITGQVRTLLHAGDIQGALQELGVRSEEPISLVKAVSENRVKELERLKKTYDFKASLEYATVQAKENALKTLRDRMASLEEQIKGLTERIENYKNEICPICFDEANTPTLTPCCSRIFCAGCILTSLTRITTCPLCRAHIQPSHLRGLTSEVKKEEIKEEEPQPLKKNEQLLQLLKQHPKGKFLVFSRYDNAFTLIHSDMESSQIKVKQLKGNKDVIHSTLKSFQKGDVQVLLLNSIEAGAGLNIVDATHVVLLHAMTHEEEKQILGRAYRLGRKEPLEVIRLLHPDEMQHTHST